MEAGSPIGFSKNLPEGTNVEITRLLGEVRDGDPTAFPRLITLVHDQLRGIAEVRMRNEPGPHTLQPTALLNEAYLKLVEQPSRNWRNRQHFFAAASQAMRHVLVDHARKRATRKRGGGWQRASSSSALGRWEHRDDLLDLAEALEKLAERSARRARVVELRIFGGLTVAECAEALGVSPKTVESHWTFAKAWLGRELGDHRPSSGGEPLSGQQS